MRRLALLLALATCASAHATETFLISIPIADVLGHREAAYTLSATGFERSVNKGYVWATGVEFGLGDKLEVGFDSDLRGVTVFNGKLQVASGDRWAVSAGINGINTSAVSTGHYVVGRYDFDRIRLHAGALRTDTTRTVVGVDCDLGHGYVFMVDTTVAAHGYTWAALNVPLGQQLVLTAAVGEPYAHQDGVQHMVGLTAAFRF